MIKKLRFLTIGMLFCIQSGYSGSQSSEPVGIQTRGMKLQVKDASNTESEVIREITSKTNNKNLEFRTERSTKDLDGTKIIHLQQYYKGVPVEGGKLVRFVTKDDTLLDEGKGRIIDNIILKDEDLNSRIEEEKALQISNDYYYKYHLGNGAVSKLSGPDLVIFNDQLVYKILLSEEGVDHNTWIFRINAKDGKIITVQKGFVFNLTPPSSSGASATVYGINLAGEGGANVSITGWRDAVAPYNYFLYYKSGTWGAWGVLNEFTDWVQNSTNNWYSYDPFSISAAKSAELTQKWLHDALGMYSIDNTGKFIEVHTWSMSASGTHYDPNTDKVYLSFPNGNYEGTLDVVAHEIGHGLTKYSYGPGTDPNYLISTISPNGKPYYADIIHTDQVAQNESYSDIIGFAVEYASQPNNLSSYPFTTPGTADWLIGEDCTSLPYKAVRDFRYPQRVNQTEIEQQCCTYYLGTNYSIINPILSDSYNEIITPNEGHVIACIQNFAFYLLAQGNDQNRTNDGHNYGVFSGVGVNVATKIALNALRLKAVNPWSTFQDERKAWRNAAQDLINQGVAPSNACNIVDLAWKAVGVEPELRFCRNGVPNMQIGANTGDVLIRVMFQLGHQQNFTGLKIRNTATQAGIACDGGMVSLATWGLEENSSNVNDPTKYHGNLIIRGPDGNVRGLISSEGTSGLGLEGYEMKGKLIQIAM
jgi:Zn-dependent metalloprotease